MVHVPKILKESVKAVKTNAKAIALSPLAIVQAHPVAAALTVVAIVGVGLAIYYYKNSNRYRENDLNYLSRANMGQDGNANGYFYDPETKSITDVPSSSGLEDKKASRKNENCINLPSATNDSNDMTVCESHNVKKINESFNNVLYASNSFENNDKLVSESHSLQKLNETNVNLQVTSNSPGSNDKLADKYHSVEKLRGNFVTLPCESNAPERNDKHADESHSAQKLDENCNLQTASNFSDSNDETTGESQSVEKLDENFINLPSASASNSPGSNEKPVVKSRSVQKLNENVHLPAASSFPQGNIEDAGEYRSVENVDENSINLLPASNFPGSNDKPAGESRSIQKLDENCITLPSASNLPRSNNEATRELHFVENVINFPSGSNSYRYWIDVPFSGLNYCRCETSKGTLSSHKSDWCKTCGENPVNTHTQPCNHRYMCGDCARKIFRCKVCHAKIDDIIVENF